jgi:hypothetical protein
MESQYSSVAIFEPPAAAAGIRARDPQIGTFRWKKCPIDASIRRRIAEIRAQCRIVSNRRKCGK